MYLQNKFLSAQFVFCIIFIIKNQHVVLKYTDVLGTSSSFPGILCGYKSPFVCWILLLLTNAIIKKAKNSRILKIIYYLEIFGRSFFNYNYNLAILFPKLREMHRSLRTEREKLRQVDTHLHCLIERNFGLLA